MKYRVRLTDRAEADVADVLAWFAAEQATGAGRKWFARLMAALDSLEKMPERCPVAVESEEIGVEIRELRLGKRHGTYRLLFQIDGRTVFILRIWHSARDQVSRDDL